MTEILLGIDLGTTGVRCVAFGPGLEVLGLAYTECPPAALGGGRVEQDPGEWVAALRGVVVEVVAGLTDARAVRAVSVSAQGITVVPVDAAGRPLRPALSWLDRRGESMLPELDGLLGAERVTARTGKPWSAAYTLPKLAWLARHEPEVVAEAAAFVGPLDFVVHWLTGRLVTDHTLASATMLYDLNTRDWADDILAAVGITRDQLPEIVQAGAPVGRLRPKVAVALGLDPGVVVAMGGQDQKCASLAAGIAPRALTVSLGTAAALESLQPTPEVPAGVPTFSYLFDGLWVRECALETAGGALRWFANAMAGHARPAELSARAARARAQDKPRPFFLPELARVGMPADLDRWGTGPSAVFWGLTLDTSADDLALAVLEGVACELERERRRMDSDAEVLRVFGGGAASEVWCQLIADTTGLVVETLVTGETAAAGAAILAGMAIGRFEPTMAGAPSLAVARSLAPGRDAARAQERFARYAELRTRLYG